MKIKKILVLTCLILGLFNTLKASDNVESTLEDLLTCTKGWGSISQSDLNTRFNNHNLTYTPKSEMKIFGGNLTSFSPFAGMSPGVSAVIDLNFETAKKNLEEKNNIIFDECEQTKYSQHCSKKISRTQTFIIYTSVPETKEGVMILCALPFRK